MPVNTGTVQAKEFSKNGKPKLKVDGKWYFAGRCDVSSVQAGQRIEFEWSEFGEPNAKGFRPKGMSNWRLVTAQTPSAATGNQDDADRPFISNVVAHAIQAGCIKAPEEIEKWAVAAQRAMRNALGAKPETPRPRTNGHQALTADYDDGPPPYEDGPPPEEPPRGTRTW